MFSKALTLALLSTILAAPAPIEEAPFGLVSTLSTNSKLDGYVVFSSDDGFLWLRSPVNLDSIQMVGNMDYEGHVNGFNGTRLFIDDNSALKLSSDNKTEFNINEESVIIGNRDSVSMAACPVDSGYKLFSSSDCEGRVDVVLRAVTDGSSPLSDNRDNGISWTCNTCGNDPIIIGTHSESTTTATATQTSFSNGTTATVTAHFHHPTACTHQQPPHHRIPIPTHTPRVPCDCQGQFHEAHCENFGEHFCPKNARCGVCNKFNPKKFLKGLCNVRGPHHSGNSNGNCQQCGTNQCVDHQQPQPHPTFEPAPTHQVPNHQIPAHTGPQYPHHPMPTFAPCNTPCNAPVHAPCNNFHHHVAPHHAPAGHAPQRCQHGNYNGNCNSCGSGKCFNPLQKLKNLCPGKLLCGGCKQCR